MPMCAGEVADREAFEAVDGGELAAARRIVWRLRWLPCAGFGLGR